MKGYERYSKLRKNENLKSKFIKNYKIDRNNSNLIVTYLNKDSEILPFSKNRVEEINQMMEDQYQKYYIETIENRYLVKDVRILAAYGLFGVDFIASNFQESLYGICSILLASGFSIYQVYQIIRCEITLSELTKQYYYMENKEYFENSSIEKYLPDEILYEKELNTLKKSLEETDSYFNLSSIDNYDLKTLRKIKCAINMSKPKYKTKRK